MINLDRTLLHADKIGTTPEKYNNCFNAKGMYMPTQFVLRLRYDIHKILENAEQGITPAKNHDAKFLQAYSTYFHETIHWWQHIGSTSGFMLNMTYPCQAHINSHLLTQFGQLTGLVKPITRYNKINSTETTPSTEEFEVINKILNNFYDIEFFKMLSFKPALGKKIVSDEMFHSLGHSAFITYSTFWSVISSPFGRLLSVSPNLDNWVAQHMTATENKVRHYVEHANLALPDIGILDLYEGQARFSQIQFLFLASNRELTWENFKEMGMLEEEYYSAFMTFLTITDSSRPESIDDPLIALFLLVIDIAINPSEGFPFEIYDLDGFVEATNPGFRFYYLCRAIRDKHPELKSAIKNHSKEEYSNISKTLCDAINCNTPLEICEAISQWSKLSNDISDLMLEEKTFEFKKTHTSIRILLSRFIRFCEDKLDAPHFFCWPGIYSAGKKVTHDGLKLFTEHQALFSDKSDGDIYPRKFPDKDDAHVQEAFNSFYAWVASYELCRQWIIEDGDFDYDFFWLTSKFSQDELKTWAAHYFAQAWGHDPDNFTILTP